MEFLPWIVGAAIVYLLLSNGMALTRMQNDLSMANQLHDELLKEVKGLHGTLQSIQYTVTDLNDRAKDTRAVGIQILTPA
jgi:hypothetical protein